MASLSDYEVQGEKRMRDTPITEENRVVCYNQTVYDDMQLELVEYFGLTMAVRSSTVPTAINPTYGQTAIKIIDNDHCKISYIYSTSIIVRVKYTSRCALTLILIFFILQWLWLV